jgi:hypothetical protein
LADFDGDWDVDDDDIDVIAQNGGMTGATWADGYLTAAGRSQKPISIWRWANTVGS